MLISLHLAKWSLLIGEQLLPISAASSAKHVVAPAGNTTAPPPPSFLSTVLTADPDPNCTLGDSYATYDSLHNIQWEKDLFDILTL